MTKASKEAINDKVSPQKEAKKRNAAGFKTHNRRKRINEQDRINRSSS